MNLGIRFSPFLVMAACLVMSTTLRAAPPQLFNKTIELHWDEKFVAKRISDGASSSGIGKQSRTIYISSAGRAFVKSSGMSGRVGGYKESGPEDSKGNVSFSGAGLSLVSLHQDLARRVAVSFDPSFSSCTATLTVGKASANARVPGYDGAGYEVISISGGAVSCSVKQGNSFGGQ